MTIETRAAFARRIGIHKSNVTRAAQAGRIVLTEDGLVDVEASLSRWHATKGDRPDVAARHAAQRGAEVPGVIRAGDHAIAGQMDATAPQHGATLETDGRMLYKTDALRYENGMIKLEMELRRGQRYQVEGAKREAHGLGATLRAAMERLIDQTAPRLAVMRDEKERRQLIAAEIKRMRILVKTDLPRALRRLRQVGAKREAT